MSAILLLASGVRAQAKPRLPQPLPLPAPVSAPRDVPYAGVIQLHVDATDVLRRIYQVHETVPVQRAGMHTFLFPQWSPGDHAPNEPLGQFAGLVMTAGGRRLHWERDPINVHAFRVSVPAGVSSLDVSYQYLGATDPNTGSVLITPTMLDVQWQTLILYPAESFTRDIQYRPSLTLPAGWNHASSLDGGTRSGDTISFPALALDSLFDQPVMAARFLKQITLLSDPVPVRLDIAAQSEADLVALPTSIKLFTPLMEQASKMFGSRHYDHYDFLVFASDEMSTYYEHHRSGEDVFPAEYFKSTVATPQDTPTLYYLAHGYIHSWNGLYRRPAEMWTPNLNTPERDSMLWVTEGLTEYWADLLCARAGVLTHDTVQELYADLSASMTRDAGAEWRTLEDTSNEPLISFRNPVSWASWQRNMFSAYSQGQMIWLEADAILRQQSGQKKSLDDFARAFFGGDDAGDITRTYTLDDMIATLQSIQPYGWREFFDSRVREYGPGRLAHSIERTGYKLAFTDQPPADEQSSKTLNLINSLGMRVSPTGRLYEVQWNGPAFQASLTVGETIVSVNGQPYKPEILVQAVKQTSADGPIDLTVKRGAWQQTTSLHWTGGLRYPHLERIEGTPALLDDMLAPRS